MSLEWFLFEFMFVFAYFYALLCVFYLVVMKVTEENEIPKFFVMLVFAPLSMTALVSIAFLEGKWGWLDD